MTTEESNSKRKTKGKGRALQVIFGCGRIGYAVAKELRGQGLDVLIVDIDEKKVELLKEEDFIAFVGDISDPEVTSKVVSEGVPEAVFIVSNNSEGNKKAVNNIKEMVPHARLVVRAIDPEDKEDLKGLGVDVVLTIPDIAARSAIGQLESVKSLQKAKELAAMIEEIKDEAGGKLGIVVHDSPDPDAIASALALRQIAKHVGVSADILYRGEIGHHVNRAFVNILGIEMMQIEHADVLEGYGKLALVDATVPGVHNPLPPPPEGKVHIIIDHHTANNKDKVAADFLEVQPDSGATSTIMTRYLQELGIPVDKVLATALLHGIRTDTGGFKRETHPSDFSAAAFLHLKADKDLLEQIETPPMSTEMLNVVGNAILHKKIKGSYLITNVGEVANLDAIPQAADYLLNLEGISTVVVIGLVEDTICVSGRSKDIRVNIGDAFVRAFGDLGSAGGHASMSAAQIPLGIFKGLKDKDTIIQLVEDAVSKRFLSVMKEEMSE
ncbi:MAG: NAD-binding protein [Methanosarcinales archaeon]|nr:NAD-binding protein [Methanosarcinales archaeon]